MSKHEQKVNELVQNFPVVVVPRDEEDDTYVKSFLHTESDAIKAFFAEFGFVVVRGVFIDLFRVPSLDHALILDFILSHVDILTNDDCDATISDLWTIAEADSPMRRNDPSTWSDWPNTGLPQYGQVSRTPIFAPQFMRNRQNPRMHSVFSGLFGNEDLIVNHDRGCLFRPTRDVIFSTGTKDMKEWETRDNLHLDMNPWLYLDGSDEPQQNLDRLRYDKLSNHIVENNQVRKKDGLTLQAVLNLEDNPSECGGFIIVPGFHKHFEAYFSLVGGSRGVASHSFAKNSELFTKRAIRIPMRRGSIVIWNQLMPHGSKHNASNRWRAAQFVRMYPRSTLVPARAKARAICVQKQLFRLPTGTVDVTPLGMQVFGFQGYVTETQRPAEWGFARPYGQQQKRHDDTSNVDA